MKNDLVGQRFGRWTVLELSHTEDLRWRCRCVCGNEKDVKPIYLRDGRSQSCGCLRAELRAQERPELRKHGEGTNGKETPEYQAWAQMRSRCSDPKSRTFKHYGGRGITVCERWSDYTKFLEDVGRRPEGTHPSGRALYSLDRKDNDKGYEPGNVRWATAKEQADNRRDPNTRKPRGPSTTYGGKPVQTPEERAAKQLEYRKAFQERKALGLVKRRDRHAVPTPEQIKLREVKTKSRKRMAENKNAEPPKEDPA